MESFVQGNWGKFKKKKCLPRLCAITHSDLSIFLQRLFASKLNKFDLGFCRQQFCVFPILDDLCNILLISVLSKFCVHEPLLAVPFSVTFHGG